MCDAVVTDPRLLQVVNVFVTSDRALAERAIGDGFQQQLFLSGLQPCFDEITHAVKIHQFARLDSCAWCRLASFFKTIVNTNWKKLRELALAEVEATLAALPKPLRERAEKLPVTFERQPNAGLQADGIEPDTLGLFTGPEFADEDHVPLPPQIILFLENLWDFAEGDEEVFRDEVHTTFLHELGHYLGLNEDELTERGLE